MPNGCILLKFYIKPQLRRCFFLIATSCILLKFYIKPQHTNNDGDKDLSCILLKFYIKPQRLRLSLWRILCCILLKFYIKPQHSSVHIIPCMVVSYWNSTSNHNAGFAICWIPAFSAVFSSRKTGCESSAEVSLMSFLYFKERRYCFFRKTPTAAAYPVSPVRFCPRSWGCLHTVCPSRTEYL